MKDIISFEKVSFSYPSGDIAIDSIDLKLPKGKKIALLGANGAGKSTLMLLLNGILKPSKGCLKYKGLGYDYRKKGLRKLRSNIGLLFPESDYQLIAPTVYEEISFGLLNQLKSEEETRICVEQVIQDFSLEDFVNKPPHQLSTGQKKRVCLAAILAMEPELVVCDEPVANLDPMYADRIFEYLEALNRKGKTILIATHDVNQAYSWADYVIVLNQGKVLMSGLPQDVFSAKKVLKDANLKPPIIIDLMNDLGLNTCNATLPKNMEELKTRLKNLMRERV